MIADDSKNGHFEPDMFDVRGTVRNVIEATRTYKWLVAITTVVVLLVAVAYVYIWPPIYRVDAMIMAEKDTDTSRDAFYGNWNVFRKDDARTEIELMTSAPVLKDVIAKEHLRYEDVYHPFMSQISYFWEISLPGRAYKSVKNKLFPDKDALPMTKEQMELGKTIADMAEGISITPVGESNVAKVSVKGPSRRVSDIANRILDVYSAWRMERYQAEAQKSVQVLDAEVARAAGDVRNIEEARLKFANEHSLTFDLQKENMELKELTDLEAAIASSKQKVASLEGSLDEVVKELAKEPSMKQISSVTELNTIRESAKMRRLELETAMLQARDHFREDSPEIQEIKGDIEKVDALLAREPEKIEKGSTDGLNVVQQQLISSKNALRSQLVGERNGLVVMEEEANQMRTRLHQVPSWQTTLHGFDRDYALTQETYQALAMKRAQAEASLTTTRSAMPSMRIVGYAMPPGGKWWPRAKLLYPGAIALGLFLGVCAAVIASFASGRVRRFDLENGHRSMPVYGSVAVAVGDRPLKVMTRAAASSSNAAGD